MIEELAYEVFAIASQANRGEVARSTALITARDAVKEALSHALGDPGASGEIEAALRLLTFPPFMPCA